MFSLWLDSEPVLSRPMKKARKPGAGGGGPRRLARGHAGRGGNARAAAAGEGVADRQRGVLARRADDKQRHAKEGKVRSEPDHDAVIVAGSPLPADFRPSETKPPAPGAAAAL